MQILATSFFLAGISLSRSIKTDGSIMTVNNSTGNNSLCQLQAERPCRTLDPISKYLTHNENILVTLETDVELSGLVEIKHSRNVTLDGTEKTIHCRKNSGFVFNNVTFFTFINLRVSGCGHQHNGTLFHYKAAMLFYHSSSELKFHNMEFVHNIGTAVALLNCSTSIEFHRVNFTRNGIANKTAHAEFAYASGVSIEVASTIPTDYKFRECHFTENVSPNNTKPSKKTSYNWEKNRGLGGAMSIIIERNAKKNFVLIENSTFYQNEGKWGGGIYADYRGKPYNNTIRIQSTTFQGNRAGKGGGGTNMGYLTHTCGRNMILIDSCKFISNTALFGGGLAIFSHFFAKKCSKSVINVRSSSWHNNTASLGAAVDLTPIDPFQNQRGFLPNITFTSCNFIENRIHYVNKTAHINSVNSGVFIATQFKVAFLKSVNFTRNQYTALYMLSGSVTFSSHTRAVFDNNSGYNGGAIALYSFSTMLVGENAKLTFTNNHAYLHGGGIYYHTMDQHNFVVMTKNCFLRTKNEKSFDPEEKPTFVFSGNTAETGGKSMYSESFKECFRFCLKKNNSNITFDYMGTFSCFGNFTFDDDDKENHSYALSSSGKEFVLTGKDKSLNYFVIPGDRLKLNFKIVDDYNHTASSVIYTKKEDSVNQSIIINQPYRESDVIYPVGKPSSCANFTATILGVRQYSITFSITLLECPPGFHFNKTYLDKSLSISPSCKCASGKEGYGMVLKCNYDSFTSSIRAGYWVGYIPENSTSQYDLYYAPCSESICNTTIHSLPNSSIGLDKYICQSNRTGILCGRCVQNFSSYHNSRDLKCGHSRYCKYGLLFYFLSEIIPMVAFFFVVVTFDISFTSGSTTAFILFSQHLAPLEIELPQHFRYLQTPYRIVYGLFNLEYFMIDELSFCLWDGFQVLDIITFKYVTILTGLGLVLTFLAIAQQDKCQRMFQLQRKVRAKISVVHGLSAFLVTCYVQSTKTTFFILKYVTPIGYSGRSLKSYSYYGGIIYFGSEHLKYAVPALISFATVTVLPPLVLILNPLALQVLALCGLSEHRIVNKVLQLTCANKLMPFLDCFQGCYKNNLRFFAGLYFAFRVAILLCLLLVQEEHYMKFYILSVVLVILGLHSITWPYKRRIHNQINTAILLNFALINVCSIFASSTKQSHESVYDYNMGEGLIILQCLQLILIYIPMFAAIVAVAMRVYTYFKSQAREEEYHSMDIDMHRHWDGIGYERLN